MCLRLYYIPIRICLCTICDKFIYPFAVAVAVAVAQLYQQQMHEWKKEIEPLTALDDNPEVTRLARRSSLC